MKRSNEALQGIASASSHFPSVINIFSDHCFNGFVGAAKKHP